MLLLIALLVFVNGLCPEDVAHFADKVIKSQLFSRSTWRVNITYVENNKLVPIYSHLPHVFSVPASNNKVLSTAAAFTHFGPNFQFQTNVYLTGFFFILFFFFFVFLLKILGFFLLPAFL